MSYVGRKAEGNDLVLLAKLEEPETQIVRLAAEE